MAENSTKRQSIGGKVPVATPNIGPSGMVSLETALVAAVGSKWVVPLLLLCLYLKKEKQYTKLPLP